MFILCKSGELVQMYSIWSSTWTTGGKAANTSMWAVELEGGPDGNESEPMTDAQVTTLLRLVEEFEKQTGRKVVRGSTFREHGEVATANGYAPTACPSNRFVKFYEALWKRDVAPPVAPFDENRIREIIREEIEKALDARKLERDFGEVLTRRIQRINKATQHPDYAGFRSAATDLNNIPPPP